MKRILTLGLCLTGKVDYTYIGQINFDKKQVLSSNNHNNNTINVSGGIVKTFNVVYDKNYFLMRWD